MMMQWLAATGWRRLLALTALGLVVTACSSRPEATLQRPQILYSPNGEPLSGGILGHPACADAVGAWFHRLDANGDGAVSLSEFLADARAQFQRMDLDHDGFITAAELSVFRQPYEETAPRDFPREVRHERPPVRTNLKDDADPVMSADRGLKFKVSEDDLLTHSEGLFAMLDTNRKGGFTLADAKMICHGKK